MPTVHVLVSGRVQGVFYRHSTREKAASLGLSGWVRNLDDGRVELEASGEKEKLAALVEWCRNGPPHARVDDLEASWSDNEAVQSGGFRVR
ncbi:MAG: acylphosphatase [Terriglobales bacterium]